MDAQDQEVGAVEFVEDHDPAEDGETNLDLTDEAHDDITIERGVPDSELFQPGALLVGPCPHDSAEAERRRKRAKRRFRIRLEKLAEDAESGRQRVEQLEKTRRAQIDSATAVVLALIVANVALWFCLTVGYCVTVQYYLWTDGKPATVCAVIAALGVLVSVSVAKNLGVVTAGRRRP